MSSAPITITGYVAKEPEVRTTNSGKSVVTVSVPHQRSKKLDGGGYEKLGATTWIEATFWEADADAIGNQVHKGSEVIITGQLESEGFTTREGHERTKLVIVYPRLAVVVKGQRDGGGRGGPVTQSDGEPWGQPAAASTSEAWSTPSASSYDDEKPF
jgi:single stranded DNA-binding protein